MTIAAIAIVALLLGGASGWVIAATRRRAVSAATAAREGSATRQILLPFTGQTVSRRAVDAAMRLAGVEGATLMPAFLATVPRSLSLDSPLPRQCTLGMPLLEAIEQRALTQGIAVDSRVSRGRSYRHALKRLLAAEHFDRVIISASREPRLGLSGEDVLWVLQRADAEVLILRPAPEDRRVVTSAGIAGHF